LYSACRAYVGQLVSRSEIDPRNSPFLTAV
jgi:hypothetical protein